MSFLEKVEYFSEYQFGLRQGMNTKAALLNFVGTVSDGINDGKKVSFFKIYNKGAFDTAKYAIFLKNCEIVA